MDLVSGTAIVFFLLAILAIIIFAKTAIVVPQQSAYVVERLGRFAGVLDAGFHILVPFVDVIRYRHSLKEQSIDIPAQVCITRDNVQVGVDGVLYLKVMNPERASYGIRTTCSRSSSSRRRRSGARSGRSTSIARSRSARTSICRWSVSSTRPRRHGA